MFDLDGTLIEVPEADRYFDDLIVEVVRDFFRIPVPPKAERDQLWRTDGDYQGVLSSWGIDDYAGFWHHFDRRDVVHRQVLLDRGRLVMYPDVVPTLEMLRECGIPVALVTNAPREIAVMELQGFGISSFFQFVSAITDDPEAAKPKPDGLRNALGTLGGDPAASVMVGDSGVDLLAARRAGVHPVWVQRGGKLPPTTPQVQAGSYTCIRELGEILDYFK